MLESDKFVDDDDFGDLYLDVEVKATCTLKKLLEEEIFDYAEAKESDSESEDGLNIVLNDDNIGGKTLEVNAKCFGDDDDEIYGMENDEDAGCGAQFKLTRPHSQSNNVPAEAASHFTLARGNWDYQTRGSGFISGSIGAQRCRNITLPRHRTILDVNIDALEGKPWRLPGADITDYFNFGLDEDSWKSYCNHLDECRGKRSNVNGYPAYNPSRHTEQDEVGSEHKMLAEAATGIDAQSIRALPLSHPKGKAIEVKEGIGERLPSVGVWHPVERGLDVIIQIPLQNSEEDLPNSAMEAVDGNSSFVQESSDFKDSGDVAHSDGGDAVCFASPSEGRLPCLEVSSEDTQSSLPERCSNSVCMESVDCGSLQGSEADEYGKLDTSESYSDGSSEATTLSSDPEEDTSGVKPLTTTRRKDLETTDAELRFSSPSPSLSRSYDSASRYGAYVEAVRVHGRSKKVSPTSSLELQDTVRRVYHSSKDSKSLGNRRKSSHSENFTRSRSPIRRNHTFHRSRSSRSRNPIQRNYKFHQERSSRMAGLKSYPDNQDACYEFHELPHHTIGHLTGRSRHQGFKYSVTEEFWHDKRSKESLYCGRKRFEDRLSGEEMDSLHYDYTGEFIAEQLPIPDHRKHAPSKGMLEEMHLTRRGGSNKLTRGCIYKNDYSRENNGCTPSYTGERDVVEYKHDRMLSYPRREADSTRKFDRVYGTIRNRDWEDQKVKPRGKPFPSSSVKYHNGGRVSFLRGDLLGSEVAQMQDRYFKRYSESELGNWDAAFHVVEDIKHLDDQDDIERHEDQDGFSRKKQCLESEELHWREERYSYWHKDVDFQAEGILNPLKRSLRSKRFGFIHDHDGKLIRYDYKQKRCKLLRKGKNDSSQFLENSNFPQKVIVERTVPGNWKSTDKHMVVGNRKFSRCFEGRGFMSNARYENSDWNDHSGQRISKDSNESHKEKTVRAENNRSKTFKGAKRDDSSDIEGGQIIVKETPCKNPKILEIIAKMEKRQERFKQPLVNVSEKNGCPSADNVVETIDSKKIQRPARKRKWIAS